MYVWVCLCVCVCVSPYDDLNTVADISILLGSYVDWRNIDEFVCQGHKSRSRSFLGRLKVTQ